VNPFRRPSAKRRAPQAPVTHRPSTTYTLSKEDRDSAQESEANLYPPRTCLSTSHKTTGHKAGHILPLTKNTKNQRLIHRRRTAGNAMLGTID